MHRAAPENHANRTNISSIPTRSNHVELTSSQIPNSLGAPVPHGTATTAAASLATIAGPPFPIEASLVTRVPALKPCERQPAVVLPRGLIVHLFGCDRVRSRRDGSRGRGGGSGVGGTGGDTVGREPVQRLQRRRLAGDGGDGGAGAGGGGRAQLDRAWGSWGGEGERRRRAGRWGWWW